jgi:hypothetical protein
MDIKLTQSDCIFVPMHFACSVSLGACAAHWLLGIENDNRWLMCMAAAAFNMAFASVVTYFQDRKLAGV